jgi:hypothetical protein
MIRLFESFLSPWLKSPSIPLYERGMTMGSPLWKRGVRGDFVEIFNSIGVLCNACSRLDFIEVVDN